MSIGHLGGRRDGWRVQAPRSEFDYGDNLFMRQMEPFRNFVDRSSHFQIVEDNGDGRPRVPENPGATALAGNAFYGGTLRPIESWHVFTLR
jgi:hypothetical protein